jgi:hypothetical protein
MLELSYYSAAVDSIKDIGIQVVQLLYVSATYEQAGSYSFVLRLKFLLLRMKIYYYSDLLNEVPA